MENSDDQAFGRIFRILLVVFWVLIIPVVVLNPSVLKQVPILALSAFCLTAIDLFWPFFEDEDARKILPYVVVALLIFVVCLIALVYGFYRAYLLIEFWLFK